MSTTPKQGVILAAGGGSRMGPLAAHWPKALLPVANESLLARHLQTMADLGVCEVFIVVGHLGHAIRDAVAAMDLPVVVHFIEQHEREGLAHAVAMLEGPVSGPFVLLLSDIYMEYGPLAPLRNRFQDGGAVLAVREEDDPGAVRRNFSVTSDDIGRVQRVVEKPVDITSMRKGCGLYLFSPTIFDAIQRTPRSPLRNEFELTDAIQTLIDDGAPVYDAPVVTWDVNVTTPEDLIRCNVHALRAMGETTLTGPGCTVAPGATLHETVLGENVHVATSCHLQRCVVLPGTTIETPGDYRDRVLYTE